MTYAFTATVGSCVAVMLSSCLPALDAIAYFNWQYYAIHAAFCVNCAETQLRQ